jgi:hypothetical protein
MAVAEDVDIICSHALFIGGDVLEWKGHGVGDDVSSRPPDAKNPAVLSHQPGF